MVSEKVDQPVVNIVRYIQLSNFLQEGGVFYCVECFTEIQCDNDDIWIAGKKVSDGMEYGCYGCGC